MRKDISRIIFSAGLLAMAFAFSGCGKEREVTPTVENSLFDKSDVVGNYLVMDDPQSEFKIGIGLSALPAADRTIQFSVSSPTGAVEGVQYSVASKSITIPAGQTRGEISLKGLFDGFPGTRKDTLVFTITGGDVPGMKSSKTYTVVLQKYCEVVLADLEGTYLCQDYDADGLEDGAPYEVEVSEVSTDGKTGVLAIDGLWGTAIPVKINLNWSNISQLSVQVPTQPWYIHAVYGQTTMRPGGARSFSMCDQEINFAFELTVNAGSFGVLSSKMKKL